MKNYYKNQKGSMTVYAIVTVFTFIFVLSAMFFRSVGIRKRQLQTMPQIKQVYEKYLNSKYQIYEAEVEKRRDKVAPEAKITLTAQTAKVGGSITATISISDNKDRLDYTKCAYVYNDKSTSIGTDASLYTGGSLSNKENSITLTFNSAGTYYVHVLVWDLDKNSTEIISPQITIS